MATSWDNDESAYHVSGSGNLEAGIHRSDEHYEHVSHQKLGRGVPSSLRTEKHETHEARTHKSSATAAEALDTISLDACLHKYTFTLLMFRDRMKISEIVRTGKFLYSFHFVARRA